ncbi:MAG: hypothetical protein AB7U25_07440 [Vicinamibacterales bacterium]
MRLGKGLTAIGVGTWGRRAFAAGIVVAVVFGGATTAFAQGVPAPTNVQATADGQAVTLTWVTSVFPPYRVQVDAGAAPGATQASFTASQTFPNTLVVTNVPTGTYYVRVRIEKDGQVSGPSSEVTVAVVGCQGAPAPPSLQGNAVGQTVMLQWSVPHPAGCAPSSLQLEAGRAPGASDVLTVDVPDYHLTQREFRSVPFGTYFVRVRANRFGVLGAPSNEVRLDVVCLPPPSILSPLATVVGNAVRFSWEYGAGASADFGVSLEAGSQPGGADIGAISIPSEARAGFNVAGVAGQYYTRLRAVNACGSTVSAEMPVALTSTCVQTQPVQFADISLPFGSPTAYLFWHPPAEGGLVTSYDLRVGTAPGLADIAQRSVDGRYTPPVGYFGETFAVPGQRVFARVAARNACGAAMPVEVYASNLGGCVNPPAPPSTTAHVTGSTVELRWTATSPASTYDTFVSIGTSFGAADVITSPIRPSYPPPIYTTTLPPGRYYARARYINRDCSLIGNPSPEVSFVVP